MITIDIEFRKMDKSQLIDLIRQQQISLKKADAKIQKLVMQQKALQTELNDIHMQNMKSKNKRKESRNELEAKNIEYLERALSIFEDFLDRPFEPQDFRKFQRYLLKVYPRPAYIQEPRLTKEEKRLSPELQEEVRELKRRTGWAPSRLSKFYEERTGVKATTKKVT
jgi:CheY-like chemotaxis protein